MAPHRYVSGPITIPLFGEDEEFSRADLEFHGVDHSGSSFEARVFLNNPEADERTPRKAESGYAGSFYIFGHGGCFGDAGHCDVPSAPVDPFDRRPPHPLTPQQKTVIVTDALKRLRSNQGGSFTVTVVPVPSDSPVRAEDDILRFERISLVTYE